MLCLGDSKRRRRRYASQGHRAKSFPKVGRDSRKGHSFFLLLLLFSPFLSCWAQQKNHVCRALSRCRRLRVVAFLSCRCCRHQRAPTLRFSPHILKSQNVCVRGYQPGLTPAKHCEGKRLPEFPTQTKRAPPPPAFLPGILSFPLRVCECPAKRTREQGLFHVACTIGGAFCGIVCFAGRLRYRCSMCVSTRLWSVATSLYRSSCEFHLCQLLKVM